MRFAAFPDGGWIRCTLGIDEVENIIGEGRLPSHKGVLGLTLIAETAKITFVRNSGMLQSTQYFVPPFTIPAIIFFFKEQEGLKSHPLSLCKNQRGWSSFHNAEGEGKTAEN